MPRFAFRFSPLYRLAAAPFGIWPRTTGVEVEDGHLTVRFGPWQVRTPLDNVIGTERSGDYSFAKTAGPAHLSFADRGLTFATNGREGLCLRFAEPVRGADPLGLIRSPGLTLTVDRPADLEAALAGSEPDSDPVDMEPPRKLLQRWATWPFGMVRALTRYAKVLTAIERAVAQPVPIDATDDPQGGQRVQTLASGVGPVVVRRYRARIVGASLTPSDLIERLMERLHAVGPTEVAEFVEQVPGDDGAAALRQEYEVRLPGPWNGPVRVVERTSTRVQLCTLEGHMEAGAIEFTAWTEPTDGEPVLVFEIASTARSGDRVFSFLYDRLRVAREMQMVMWVTVCRDVAGLAGGQVDGKVVVETVELEAAAAADAA